METEHRTSAEPFDLKNMHHNQQAPIFGTHRYPERFLNHVKLHRTKHLSTVGIHRASAHCAGAVR